MNEIEYYQRSNIPLWNDGRVTVPEMNVPGTIKVEFGFLNPSHLFVTDADVILCVSIVGHLVCHLFECLNSRIPIFITQVLDPDYFVSHTRIEKEFRVIRCKLSMG